MADSVTSWKSGQNPTPGVPSVGYPYCDFTWNDPDTDSSAALTSESFAYPGKYFTVVVNASADSVGGSADIVYHLYGSNDDSLAIAKWDIVKTATIGSAAIHDLVTFVEINTVNDEGYFKFYKLKLNPSADVGEECTVRVGINAPSLGLKG